MYFLVVTGIPQPLPPGQSIYYTWIVPESDRILHWSFVGTKKKHEFENSLQSDGGDFIQLGPNEFLTWVSFLDGMQRVLPFTGLLYLKSNKSISRKKKFFKFFFHR